MYVLPDAVHKSLPSVLSLAQYLQVFGRKHMLEFGTGGVCSPFSFALTRMSFRFLGRLKAANTEDLCMDLVVQDFPSRSQLLVTTFFRPKKPGL